MLMGEYRQTPSIQWLMGVFFSGRWVALLDLNFILSPIRFYHSSLVSLSLSLFAFLLLSCFAHFFSKLNVNKATPILLFFCQPKRKEGEKNPKWMIYLMPFLCLWDKWPIVLWSLTIHWFYLDILSSFEIFFPQKKQYFKIS